MANNIVPITKMIVNRGVIRNFYSIHSRFKQNKDYKIIRPGRLQFGKKLVYLRPLLWGESKNF